MTLALAVDGHEPVYLNSFLAPFLPWLEAADVTEILVNQPGEVWIERVGTAGMVRYLVPEIDAALLKQLAFQVARTNHQGISRESPLLAATLPGGARIQIVAPPATRRHMAIAIRKHLLSDLSLDDYAATGAFAQTVRSDPGLGDSVDMELSALLDRGDMLGFLRAAMTARKTILLSGGTSSGKTTLLNALLKDIPAAERVIVIEDTPEIHLGRENALGLVAVAGGRGEAKVSIDDLMRASLRMRPDRLLVGELRGAEVVTFLRAINTGHPGSLATIHASSPKGAFEQIALMCVQADLGLARAESIDLALSLVDIVVQLRLRDGRRVADEVHFTPSARTGMTAR